MPHTKIHVRIPYNFKVACPYTFVQTSSNWIISCVSPLNRFRIYIFTYIQFYRSSTSSYLTPNLHSVIVNPFHINVTLIHFILSPTFISVVVSHSCQSKHIHASTSKNCKYPIYSINIIMAILMPPPFSFYHLFSFFFHLL